MSPHLAPDNLCRDPRSVGTPRVGQLVGCIRQSFDTEDVTFTRVYCVVFRLPSFAKTYQKRALDKYTRVTVCFNTKCTVQNSGTGEDGKGKLASSLINRMKFEHLRKDVGKPFCFVKC